jgi:hypothetical protein
VAVIKPGALLKLVGKSLGDAPIDLLAAGAPATSVRTAYTVTNGADTTRHCSAFGGCAFKEIAGGAGRKLVCKGGSPDPDCDGSGAPTTTTTITATTSTSTTIGGPCESQVYPTCGGQCSQGLACSPIDVTDFGGLCFCVADGPCGCGTGGQCPGGEVCRMEVNPFTFTCVTASCGTFSTSSTT